MRSVRSIGIKHFPEGYWIVVFPTVDLSGGSDCKESACNVEDLVSFPGWEDPLEKEMATHSSILAWAIPWTEEPGEIKSMESQRVGQWLNNFHLSCTEIWIQEICLECLLLIYFKEYRIMKINNTVLLFKLMSSWNSMLSFRGKCFIGLSLPSRAFWCLR